MYNYQSDATQFLQKYIEEHPEEQADFAAGKVAKKPYTYYSY